MLQRPRNSGGQCAWKTNSLVHQYLHQLPLVHSSRCIQHMQTVLCSNQILLLLFNCFERPVFVSQTKKPRNRMCLVDSLVGQYLHQLSLVQKFQICTAHADSHSQSNFFSSIFRKDQSFLHKPRNLGRE